MVNTSHKLCHGANFRITDNNDILLYVCIASILCVQDSLLILLMEVSIFNTYINFLSFICIVPVNVHEYCYNMCILLLQVMCVHRQ